VATFSSHRVCDDVCLRQAAGRTSYVISAGDIDRTYSDQEIHEGSVMNEMPAMVDDSSMSLGDETTTFDDQLDVIIPTDEDEIEDEDAEVQEVADSGVDDADEGENKDGEIDNDDGVDDDDDDEPEIETEIM